MDNEEDEPLNAFSAETEHDEVNLKAFASSCGRSHKLDLLQRASDLLRGKLPDEIATLTVREKEALRWESSKKWYQPRLLYFTIAVCSLGAIEQGWGQTSMNGANLYFPEALGIGSSSAADTFIVGLINSGIYLGMGLCGTWLSDPINGRLGRRGAILTGSVLCFLGNLGSTAANWFSLLCFRLMLGTGLGINGGTITVFAAECAPASIRGGLTVFWQMWTAFGIFLGLLANIALHDYGSNTWRLQLAAPFVPVLLLIFMIYLCPESPAWYVKKGQYDLAYKSLITFRNTELQAAKELYDSYCKQLASFNPLETPSSYLSRIKELFTIPRICHATLASMTTMLCQQLCGINLVTIFSSSIFYDAGFTSYGALVASCVFGFVNFLGAFPAVWAMDILGRRSLLLWTLPLMALTMLAIGLTFKLPEGNFQFGLLASLIYLFCAEYSPGMGPVPFIYSAEAFPLSHREVGMSVGLSTTSIWEAGLSLTFPSLLVQLGAERTFELYAALNVLALLLVFVFVRETKRKTLSELDEVFAVEVSVYVKDVAVEQLSERWRSYLPMGKGVNTPSTRREYSELMQDEEGDHQRYDLSSVGT